MNFPRTVEEITPEWLTQVLRESGAIDRAKVVSITESNIGDDRGVAADVRRLILTNDRIDENAPPSIIAKFGRQDRLDSPVTGDVARAIYDREVRFFLELAHKSGMRTPAAYYANFAIATRTCSKSSLSSCA